MVMEILCQEPKLCQTASCLNRSYWFWSFTLFAVLEKSIALVYASEVQKGQKLNGEAPPMCQTFFHFLMAYWPCCGVDGYTSKFKPAVAPLSLLQSRSQPTHRPSQTTSLLYTDTALRQNPQPPSSSGLSPLRFSTESLETLMYQQCINERNTRLASLPKVTDKCILYLKTKP